MHWSVGSAADLYAYRTHIYMCSALPHVFASPFLFLHIYVFQHDIVVHHRNSVRWLILRNKKAISFNVADGFPWMSNEQQWQEKKSSNRNIVWVFESVFDSFFFRGFPCFFFFHCRNLQTKRNLWPIAQIINYVHDHDDDDHHIIESHISCALVFLVLRAALVCSFVKVFGMRTQICNGTRHVVCGIFSPTPTNIVYSSDSIDLMCSWGETIWRTIFCAFFYFSFFFLCHHRHTLLPVLLLLPPVDEELY